MKRRLLLLLGIATMVVSSDAASAGSATGAARLHPIDRSGVHARINFVDTGSVLEVSGTATGLDSSKPYITLVYDNGSVPGGPEACEPTNNSLTFAQMFVGSWQPVGSSTRTLTATKSGPAYAPLSAFDTTSVRQFNAADPEESPLKACGQVHTNP